MSRLAKKSLAAVAAITLMCLVTTTVGVLLLRRTLYIAARDAEKAKLPEPQPTAD